jgi:hypothetical protein
VKLTQGQEPDPPQSTIVATGSGFTYQGQLSHEGAIVDNSCDFTFGLYDAASDGDRLGDFQSVSNVTVEDGRFTVILNDSNQFGPNAFDGSARWLDITVQCAGDSAPTYLGRQPLTRTPYASYALEAASAASAPWNGITGVPPELADGDDDTTYSAGAGLLLNSGEFSAQGSPYANVVVVAKSGGDFTHIQAAIDSIDDASESNRYLVWIAPGLYEEQVIMKPYVDLQGAAQNLTTIRWIGSNLHPINYGDSATLQAAENAEFRSLTIESDGAIGGGSPRIYTVAVRGQHLADNLQGRDVTLSASGATNYNYGLFTQSVIAAHLSNATISASGGIRSRAVRSSTTTTLDNVKLFASGGSNSSFGLYLEGGTTYVHNSQLQGETFSVRLAFGTAHLAGTKLNGTAYGVNLTCVHSYDANYSALGTDCQ